MDNPHVFDQVTQDTDLLLVDDCDRYLNLGLFYDNITSDMTVNPKNNHSFTIGFDDSPKLAFTTNYVPTDFDPSSEARSLYMVFSDWYHQKTEENDYYDNRSIRDDFGKTLYAYDYTEEEWNADLNFWLQCCQFYLSVMDSGVKPHPPWRISSDGSIRPTWGQTSRIGPMGTSRWKGNTLMSIWNVMSSSQTMRDMPTSTGSRCRASPRR